MVQSSPSAPDLTTVLPRIALFADLTPAQLTALARIVRRQQFSRGAVIIAQGEVGEVAFLILSGSVDIAVCAPDGRQFVLAELGPLEYFGEMALLDDTDRQRSATVVAREKTELVLIRRDDFLALLDQHPSIARYLLRSLSRRLRLANEKIAGLAFADVARRLAGTVLASAANEHGRLIVRATHEELAAMTGAARQTVTRVLNTWRRHGYIATGREQLLILDPAGLRAIAEGD
ncbi:MAG TPA: Crp/Fnr family transcriptional regulator [Chloroflexota bacterium]|nr:Crp/Fnr family transcriptional regulator [Chloroflexota bacterium]HZU05601.1 Crp/Fnr family transcriptional regulator [Chloroflexota bacterium]